MEVQLENPISPSFAEYCYIYNIPNENIAAPTQTTAPQKLIAPLPYRNDAAALSFLVSSLAVVLSIVFKQTICTARSSIIVSSSSPDLDQNSDQTGVSPWIADIVSSACTDAVMLYANARVRSLLFGSVGWQFELLFWAPLRGEGAWDPVSGTPRTRMPVELRLLEVSALHDDGRSSCRLDAIEEQMSASVALRRCSPARSESFESRADMQSSPRFRWQKDVDEY